MSNNITFPLYTQKVYSPMGTLNPGYRYQPNYTYASWINNFDKTAENIDPLKQLKIAISEALATNKTITLQNNNVVYNPVTQKLEVELPNVSNTINPTLEVISILNNITGEFEAIPEDIEYSYDVKSGIFSISIPGFNEDKTILATLQTTVAETLTLVLELTSKPK
jgi:hypothetical protein